MPLVEYLMTNLEPIYLIDTNLVRLIENTTECADSNRRPTMIYP